MRIAAFLCVAMSIAPVALGQVPEPQKDAAQLIERYRQEKCPLWSDGDQLTAFYEGEADSVQVTTSGTVHKLHRIAGTKIWYWTGAFKDLRQGVFSYTWDIQPMDSNDASIMNSWRGPMAPPAIKTALPIKGKVTNHKLASKVMGSERDISVYLPPTIAGPLPVVYSADGQDTSYYIGALEALILEAKIPPTAFVGVHNGGYEGGMPKDFSQYDAKKDLRAAEYLPVFDFERFQKHEKFFAEEVTQWAEKQFRVSSKREDRAVFGYSNGGRFAATIGVDRPDVFGNVFAFSLAVGTPAEFSETPKVSSRFFFCAGRWEESFLKRSAVFHKSLLDAGVKSQMVERVSGHDTIMWQEEFAHAVQQAFAK